MADQIQIFGGYAVPLPANLPIRYSRGANKFDNCPDQRIAKDFNGFLDAILNDRGQAKHQQYITSGMNEGPHNDSIKYPGVKAYRLNRLAQPRAFLMLDADGMPSMDTVDALQDAIDQISGCIYTTSSHTEENPRVRGILALSREVTGSEGMRLGKAVERYLESRGIVGVKWDASVYQPAQPCYLPLESASSARNDGGYALDADALLNSPYADEVDTTGSTLKDSAVTEFSALSLEDQKALLEGIQSELQAHKEIVETSGGYDTREAKAQANVVNKLGASLCHCWVFDDSSLNAVCTELTRNYVNALNRNQWVSRVMLGARMAPVGSEDAESIKAEVRTWSERHSCYDGHLATGNDLPEFEPHGRANDPFKDFADRWSEGERTARTDNCPFSKFWYMSNNRMPVPRVRLSDGTDFDLFDMPHKNGIEVDPNGLFGDLGLVPDQLDLPIEVEAQNFKFVFKTASEVRNTPPMKWRIKELLPERGFGLIFGESGSGKSFMVFDMGASLALGRSFYGRKVKPCNVVYVALEGGAGISKRVQAWEKYHDQKMPDSFRIVTDALSLLNSDALAFASGLSASGLSGGVVIIDTLNQSAPGADENSPADMGRIISNAMVIQRLTDSLVVLVHHTGKDKSKGPRGHSSLHGALDVAIEVKKTASGREWGIYKLKDAENGLYYPFKLEVVDLGVDEDGDSISSCVALGDLFRTSKPNPPTGKNQVAVLGAIKACAGDTSALTYADALKAGSDALVDVETKHRKERAAGAIDGLTKNGNLILNDGTLEIVR